MEVYVVMANSSNAERLPECKVLAVYKTNEEAVKRVAEERNKLLESDTYKGVEHEIEADESGWFSIYIPFDSDSDEIWVSEQTVIE